jgi:hypothetical protein
MEICHSMRMQNKKRKNNGYTAYGEILETTVGILLVWVG